MNNSFAAINFNDPESKNIFKNQKKMRCPKYSSTFETVDFAKLNIINDNKNKLYIVNGHINDRNYFSTNKLFIKYSAANKPTYNRSFSGSALPYPSEEIAFQNSSNIDMVPVVNNKFSFNLVYPNSYYINMGSEYVPPQVKIVLINDKNEEVSKVQIVPLGEGTPFRTLTWSTKRDWNKGADFYYNNNLPVIDQYDILLDSKYPITNTVPNNFWGKKPPL